MKKIVSILFVLVVLSSCIMTQKISYKDTVIVDYNRYANIGFFITESNSVNFEYKPIGSVNTTVVGETEVLDKETGRKIKRDFHIYDAIDEIVRQSKRMGADGIIGFQFSRKIDYQTKDKGYVVSGMAIKRQY